MCFTCSLFHSPVVSLLVFVYLLKASVSCLVVSLSCLFLSLELLVSSEFVVNLVFTLVVSFFSLPVALLDFNLPALFSHFLNLGFWDFLFCLELSAYH